MIKTLIFDLGGVIVPFDFKRAYARMAPLCGYPADQIPERLRGTNIVTRFESGHMDSRQFAREVSAILELGASYDEFCELLNCIFLPDTLIPETFFQNLKSRYRLSLLSNTNPIHFEMIQREYPLLRHFDDFVLSYEVGAVKPSAEIYTAALARADSLPEECFFTDDLLSNVEGARRQGMHAIQFESYDQLTQAMNSLGIL